MGEAFEDSVKGHELQVVLVRTDPKMSDSSERPRFREAVGDEKFGVWSVKFHGLFR
jgi:hypothetical protein